MAAADVVLPVLVFVAGVADVSFGTGRMLMVSAGFRWQAAALAMVQIGIFVVAISAVVTNLDNPFALVGYVLGWGAGTFLAMWVENRLAIGYRLIQVINNNPDISVCEHLRASGMRVTRLEGHGLSGPVEVSMTVIRRRTLDRVREQIMAIAPNAFITIERAERPIGGSATEQLATRRWPWARSRPGTP